MAWSEVVMLIDAGEGRVFLGVSASEVSELLAPHFSGIKAYTWKGTWAGFSELSQLVIATCILIVAKGTGLGLACSLS